MEGSNTPANNAPQPIPNTQSSNTSFPGPIDTLKQSWNLFTQNAIKFILITFFPTLLAFGLIFAGGAITGLLGYLAYQAQPILLIPLVTIGIILYVIVMIAVTAWGQVSLINAINLQKTEDQIPGLLQVYKDSKKFIIPAIWIGIITSLIITGGYVLLIIPGIILSFFLMFGQYILVTEGHKGLTALKASREYIRGYGIKVFINLLVLTIIYIFVLAVPGAILEAINLSFLSTIYDLILGIVISPLTIIVIFVIFTNLKQIKGQVQPVVASSNKKYIALAVIGLIAPFLIVGIMGYAVLTAINPLEQLEKSQQLQDLYNQEGIDPQDLDNFSESELNEFLQNLPDTTNIQYPSI